MSVDITMTESARKFNVYVGGKQVGRVTCYTDPDDAPDCESFNSERRADDGTYTDKGWHTTLKKAGLAAMDHTYDVYKIDKVIKRKV